MAKHHAGFWTGALAGLLTTAPTVGLLYGGWKLTSAPFAPFDLFDWISRELPGAVVTQGIDTLVWSVRASGAGSTASTAKSVEHAIGIAIFLLAGVAAAAIVFAIARAGRAAGLIAAVAIGIVAGVCLDLIGPGLNGAGGWWTFGVLVVWGLVVAWILDRLSPPVLQPGDVRSSREGSVEAIDRRHFLIRVGGVSAVITVAGAVVGAEVGREPGVTSNQAARWSSTHALPNAGASVKPVPGTRPEYTPLQDHYRIDIDSVPPSIDASAWRLRVGGLVDESLTLTIDDLRSAPPLDQFITLSCISNPVGGDLTGTTRWTGVSLQRLVQSWRVKPAATHLKLTSADGFFEVASLDTIARDPRVMLTYAWDGVPLLPAHGFPLRIYIPDVYGMKQPKWIVAIDAIDHWEAGYWVVRGWDRKAQMKATSVIDTVAVDRQQSGANGQPLVPIGGIAHAGARGISRVEVRMDDGPWQEAELRRPLSDLTWVIWRHEMPVQSGDRTLTVRCWDGNGTPQIVEPAPPHPSGATGLDTRTVQVS